MVLQYQPAILNLAIPAPFPLIRSTILPYLCANYSWSCNTNQLYRILQYRPPFSSHQLNYFVISVHQCGLILMVSQYQLSIPSTIAPSQHNTIPMQYQPTPTIPIAFKYSSAVYKPQSQSRDGSAVPINL